MREPQLSIPPWSHKRRLYTAAAISGFIFLTASFIGFGIYNASLDRGYIDEPLNKKSVLASLFSDAEFYRTLKHAARRRICINQTQQVKVTYEAPFGPTSTSGDEACLKLVAVHPTGETVLLTLQKQEASREVKVSEISKQYSSVQTDFLPGSTYTTSVISGISNGIPTTHYVIETEYNIVWILSYQPTSPILDGDVLAIVQQLKF